MNHKDGDNPDFLDGLGDMLPADVLKKLNELLARLHQADHTNHGSTVINIYEKGSLHVDHVDNQNFYNDSGPRLPKTPKTEDAPATKTFDQDTPLSALFRDNHHEELRMVIDSWRPYLSDDDAAIDALALNRFEFDKDRIYANRVYRDLCGLDARGALHVSLSQLARYLTGHSNLSRSYATLYQQLKTYRGEWS
jgi:hypothetical protein